MKFALVKTCHECPEQYDVYLGAEKVGYMRLRHGYFCAECPYGEIVYESHDTIGDGIFDPNERDVFLTAACIQIWNKLSRGGNGELYEIIEHSP